MKIKIFLGFSTAYFFLTVSKKLIGEKVILSITGIYSYNICTSYLPCIYSTEQTVDKEYYLLVLECWKDAACDKQQEMWDDNIHIRLL